MKTKLNSDDELLLNKTVKNFNTAIAFRVVFHEYNKYYLHVFLDECLYEL